jgi:hypothetical protein
MATAPAPTKPKRSCVREDLTYKESTDSNSTNKKRRRPRSNKLVGKKKAAAAVVQEAVTSPFLTKELHKLGAAQQPQEEHMEDGASRYRG